MPKEQMVRVIAIALAKEHYETLMRNGDVIGNGMYTPGELAECCWKDFEKKAKKVAEELE